MLILFIAACASPKLLGDFSLTAEMISSVPYEGSEKLIFMEGQKEIILDCEGRKREKHEVLGGTNTVDYYITENDKTEFSANGYYLSFSMRTSSYWYVLPELIIVWYSEENELSENAMFIVPIDTNYLENKQGYLLNYEVQNQIYDLVYYDSVYFDSTEYGLHKPAVFYYHQNAGLIKIDFIAGDSWELKRIEQQ